MNRVNLWWCSPARCSIMSIILDAKSQWSICRIIMLPRLLSTKKHSVQYTDRHASTHSRLCVLCLSIVQCPAVSFPAYAFPLSDSGCCCCVKKNILCSQKKYSSSQQLYDECLTLCWCFKYFIFARNAFEIKEIIHNEYLWKEYNTANVSKCSRNFI